jgi:hypothetical protein
MKICGETTFDEDFKWTPKQLLTMIATIDAICPEEGLPNPPTSTPDPKAQNANNVAGKVVLLPQLGIHGEEPAYCGLIFRPCGIHKRRKRRVSLDQCDQIRHLGKN